MKTRLLILCRLSGKLEKEEEEAENSHQKKIRKIRKILCFTYIHIRCCNILVKREFDGLAFRDVGEELKTESRNHLLHVRRSTANFVCG